jgi:hypothetical protein
MVDDQKPAQEPIQRPVQRPIDHRGWIIVVFLVAMAAIGAAMLMVKDDKTCVDYVAPPGWVPPCRVGGTHLSLENGVAMCRCPGNPMGPNGSSPSIEHKP